MSARSSVAFANEYVTGVPSASRKETDPPKGRYGLVYPNADFFFHTPLVYSLGGAVKDEKQEWRVTNEGMIASLAMARRLFKDERIIPDDPSPVTESSMFSDRLNRRGHPVSSKLWKSTLLRGAQVASPAPPGVSYWSA